MVRNGLCLPFKSGNMQIGRPFIVLRAGDGRTFRLFRGRPHSKKNGLTSFPSICLFHAANKIQKRPTVSSLVDRQKRAAILQLPPRYTFVGKKNTLDQICWRPLFSRQNRPISYLLADFKHFFPRQNDRLLSFTFKGGGART